MSNWLLDARVVPWSTWSEWAEVRRLARGDVSELKRAHAITACWRLRRGGVMPITLQTDLSLRLLLSDETQRGTYEWRLSVSMALVRLVNGLTDRLQGSRARSVKALSEQLQLPSSLVSIRHAATHNALPGGQALTNAAHAALQWIDDKYWTPQANAAKVGPTTLDDIRRVFEEDAPSDRQPQSSPSHAPHRDIDILLQMRELTSLLKSKQVSESSLKKPKERKRWRACGNEEEWMRVPLGLCPWQTDVGFDLTSLEGTVSVPPTQEEHDTVNEEANDEQADPSPFVLMPIKRRRLTSSDIASARTLSAQLTAT